MCWCVSLDVLKVKLDGGQGVCWWVRLVVVLGGQQTHDAVITDAGIPGWQAGWARPLADLQMPSPATLMVRGITPPHTGSRYPLSASTMI